ncbi:MAG: hypothetical protein KGL39_53630 [Patescibacteria group bacterium]|nr:hypothetical protein [Patescibacteria group bacterium]
MDILIGGGVIVGVILAVTLWREFVVPWYRRQLTKFFEWRLAGPHREWTERFMERRMFMWKAWGNKPRPLR